MPETRKCAACGEKIQWVRGGGGLLPLDFTPSPPAGPEIVVYAIIDGYAIRPEHMADTHRPFWSGPTYRNHVATCKSRKPKEQ